MKYHFQDVLWKADIGTSTENGTLPQEISL